MWSLYRKLKRYDMDPDKVMDLVALRIIVPDERSCYEAMGVVHAHYKPMPGRVKDYIALPKPNGYRSLHTTVFCEKGHLAEIQIRTPRMHDHAENGVAAHWHYSDSGKRSVSAKQAELAWINQLKQSLKEIKTSQGMANVKIDFFHDRIFVLTPHGEIKDLPEGATPVDFAYAVHSELGHRVTGALVNGRIVPIAQPLESGDVVEVIRGKHAKPSMDWLKSLKTNHAAKKVRSWFKKNDPSIAIRDGRALLNKELVKGKLSVDKLNRRQINQLLASTSSKTLDDLLTHLSMRDFDAVLVARVLLPEPKRRRKPQLGAPPAITRVTNGGSTVILAGQPGLAYRLGKCCKPAPGDIVIGYLTMARGVTVHQHDCTNLRNAEERRLMEAAWR
jgi:GTP pyrophosphokinase